MTTKQQPTHEHDPYVVGTEVLCRGCSEVLPTPTYAEVQAMHRRSRELVVALRALEELGETEVLAVMGPLWRRVHDRARQDQKLWEDLRLYRNGGLSR